MKIVNGLAPKAMRLAKLQPELSKEASKRLKWFDYYEKHDHNARLSCRYFGITPQTFYSSGLVEVVLKLREKYPRWGKEKLVILIHAEGYQTSASTVGRIIHHLKERGVLKEPVRNHVSAHRRGLKRPYGIRKPKDYQIKEPGDLVELDTLDIRPLAWSSTQALYGSRCYLQMGCHERA
jgi:putative transposase